MRHRRLSIPYDKLWKSIVTDHFEDFLAMFLPQLHKEVDYTIPFKFLEQELKAVLVDQTLKQIDKLVGVKLKSGMENWVFVHIEFENSPKPSIKERMYNYHYRIKEKYGQDITALVIYTGRHTPKNPNLYEKETFGTVISYKYNTYEIIKQNIDELKANLNPFAVVVLANLYVLLTYNQDQERLRLKEEIYFFARQRNYPDEKTNKLILFLSELMKLPVDLEMEFFQYISKPQKHTDTMYITKTSRDLIDVLAKQAFGKTVSELNASLKDKDAALKNKNATIKNKDATIKNKDATIKNKDAALKRTISHLQQKLQMSLTEIAAILQMETDEVEAIIAPQKKTKVRNDPPNNEY